MSCRRFHDALALAAGGDLDGAEQRALDRHLATCPACASFLEDLSRDREALLRLAREDIPESVLAEVRHSVRHSVRQPVERDQARWRTSFALAAALALAILGVVAIREGITPKPHEPVVEARAAVDKPPRDHLPSEMSVLETPLEDATLEALPSHAGPANEPLSAPRRRFPLQEALEIEPSVRAETARSPTESAPTTLDELARGSSRADTLSPMVIQWVIDDPDLVIYWLVDPEPEPKENTDVSSAT